VYRLKYGGDWKRRIENSRDPVHIDLYRARELKELFAPVIIATEKYECRYWPRLEHLAGWFLVAKGAAPHTNHSLRPATPVADSRTAEPKF
jgi:hypothetical protein